MTPIPCPRCQTLEDENAYLRLRLADRLNADLVRILIETFAFSPVESRLVAALYQARSLIPIFDLELVIKSDANQDYGLHSNPVSVFLSRIRAKTSPAFIDTIRGQGLALSAQARRLVAEAVERDRNAHLPEASPLPPHSPQSTETWTRERRRKLHRLLRLDGASYEQAARILKTTRGAVASAAKRFGYQTHEASKLSS